MIALAIAGVNIRRLFRYRTGLFFIFILPVILIVALGTMYGGRTAPRLGVVVAGGGPLASDLVDAIRAGDVALDLRTLDSESALRAGVESGTLELGLVIPADYDAALRGGGTAQVVVLGRTGSVLSALRQAVDTAVTAQAARIRAARLVESEAGVPFDRALGIAAAVQSTTPGVTVSAVQVGEGIFPAGTAAFAPGAESQLILFMFLTSMTAATQLILSRQLGVSRRMFAAPVGITTIAVGEVLGRFAVAMIQGLFIVLLSALAFGVPWGDPLAAGTIVVMFALVGTGAAMVVGVFASDADQAGALGVMAGMLLGALGGAMVPLEIFPEPVHTIAFLTPQAWAIQALRSVGLHGSGVADILPELAVLALFAAALIGLGSWQFRRALSS